MTAFSEPTAELADLAAALGGRPTPCMTGDPDDWFEQPEKAASACLEACHALAECAVLADAVGATHGVWAGVDRTRSSPANRRAVTR